LGGDGKGSGEGERIGLVGLINRFG
jgi:hypothetical protein